MTDVKSWQPAVANDRSMAAIRIDIVMADRGWILEKIATEIKGEADRQGSRFRITLTTAPTGDADLVYFLPESAFVPLENCIVVTYLAHKEDHAGAAKHFERVARASDVCITSSARYEEV